MSSSKAEDWMEKIQRQLLSLRLQDLQVTEMKVPSKKYQQGKCTVHSTESLNRERKKIKVYDDSKTKQPPGDFRSLNIFPMKKDFHDCNSFLRPNIIDGTYYDVNYYLDVQFRLLREDYFRPLRIGISTYIKLKTTKQNTDRIEGLKVHENVYIFDHYSKSHGQKLFMAKFTSDDFSKIDWKDSKRFLPGSLLFFTSDNFRTVLVASIERNDGEELKDGHIFVRFQSSQSKHFSFPPGLRFVVIETDAYFVAYQHNLRALQGMNLKKFPMVDYIVYGRKKSTYPNYLKSSPLYDFAPLLKHATEKQLYPVTRLHEWPSPTDLDLEKSQYEALKAAVTNEFVIIQGPPGTGKTFIGLKLVQLLVHNSSANELGPILILCYTNHSLDQFLAGILEFTDEIVRIGENCVNINVEPYKMSNILYPGRSKRSIKLRILSDCKVIGATITGAAMNKSLLNKLMLRIVIIEEAAEILESVTVSSLPLQTEHLILIGDHQQLRPKTNVHELTTKFNMDVSLFERMVKNGIECHQLNIQYRMRPSIAALLVPHIYSNLKNDISVKNLDNMLGVTKNLFFLTHDKLERSLFDSASKVNDHEASFIVALCFYLLQQGYTEDEITILATYAAQVSLIQELLKKSDRNYLCANVRVSTVDGYQGEENEIILISFVRSNDKKIVGFLSSSNRLCVALSRAKKGLFCIGNFTQYAEKSKLWRKIVRTLTTGHHLGTWMSLICKRHFSVTDVCKSSDFSAVRDGGCFVPCRMQLQCGHFCQMKCHPETSHQEYKCMEICDKIIGKKRHRCKNLCFEECVDCDKRIRKRRKRKSTTAYKAPVAL